LYWISCFLLLNTISIQPDIGSGNLECWFQYSFLVAYLYGAVRVMYFVINVGFLCIVIYKLQKSKLWNEKIRKTKGRTLLFIQLCYLIETVAGLLALSTVFSLPEIYASFIMGGMQGVLNSIVIGRKPLTNLFKKLYKFCSPKRVVSNSESGNATNTMGSEESELRRSYLASSTTSFSSSSSSSHLQISQ